jgi:2,3-bisphosphoglycerate-independent phosphoglycerate mutase
MQKKTLLMILDGWGIARNPEVSAIEKANTPFMDSLVGRYPQAQLEASGLAVGLPDGQMGNSEVGHMNLGAGRIVYQDLVKINLAFESGDIRNNAILQKALAKAQKKGKKLHFIGLVSDGGVHAHCEHLKGLLTLAAEYQIANCFVHAFTDGRDCDPKSGLGFIADVEQHMQKTTGKMASIVGRYFAMDRDKRWERVKLAYDLLVHGIGKSFTDAQTAMEASYAAGVTDEFVQPVILDPNGIITPGDVVINFNFRTDRGREITQVLTQEAFHEYNMAPLDLHYVTLTRYDETFRNIEVVFEKDNLNNTLGQVVSDAGKTQIRIAETEKYPHVTFFFSGGREQEYLGERRILCPSPKVATYDLKPEMSAADIRDAIVPELQQQTADFICLNFANPDMVGHTGVFDAAVKACETVDQCAAAVTKAALEAEYATIIIADHGNADCMENPDGSPNTAHTTQPVPFFLVSDLQDVTLQPGVLGDIAPTILHLMGLEKPADMTGKCLIK